MVNNKKNNYILFKFIKKNNYVTNNLVIHWLDGGDKCNDF